LTDSTPKKQLRTQLLTQNSNSKQFHIKNGKSKIGWGFWAFATFLLVIAVLIYFGYECRKNTRNAIEDRLSLESAAYSMKFGNALDKVVAEGSGTVSVIGRHGITADDQLKVCAQGLADDLEDVYLVVITDNSGIGYSSTGEEINLSSMDYHYIGAGIQYSYTDDDGITGEQAFVITVPFAIDNVLSGYVYLFTLADDIYNTLPTKNYGNNLSFALVNSEGNVISKYGADSYFNSGDNLFTQLNTASVSGFSLSQIKLKAEKLTKVFFYASKGSEERAIMVSPIGNSNWELVSIINSSYVDALVESEMVNVVRLIVVVILALCVFVVCVALIFLLNRSKQKEEKENLEDKADTDLLTGLNNKIATERKIQEYMTANPDTQCLMFLFDIDNFKKINDTMGHSFGDEVLRTLGHQLANEFRVSDIIGRLGGDEFVILLKNIKNEEQLEREGQRITALFHQFKAGDYVKYSATASIGAVVFPKDAKDFQSAYKAADKALYEAKRRGKNQLVFYNSNLSDVKSIKIDDSSDKETK